MANAGPLLLLPVVGVVPFQQGDVSVPIARRDSYRLPRALRPARSLCLIGGVRGRLSW